MKLRWENCLVHLDNDALAVLDGYFRRPKKNCLLIAGAGFDPRALYVGEKLHSALGDGLHALLIREDRGDPSKELMDAANANEARFRDLISSTEVRTIDIFDPQDRAAIGGRKIVETLNQFTWASEISDVVLDVSALSIGVIFPAASFLLTKFKDTNTNVHIVIASNPEMDAAIVGEPTEKAIDIQGFKSSVLQGDGQAANIWMPHLVKESGQTLENIFRTVEDIYKICPILPFPAKNPRRADDLISEYTSTLADAWEIAPRDFMYVSEWNPLDTYRALSTMKSRFFKTVDKYYKPQIVLSPIGSKVMAVGAFMAAYEHKMQVRYVETYRYDVRRRLSSIQNVDNIQLVHIWADGPVYAGIRP